MTEDFSEYNDLVLFNNNAQPCTLIGFYKYKDNYEYAEYSDTYKKVFNIKDDEDDIVPLEMEEDMPFEYTLKYHFAEGTTAIGSARIIIPA